MRFGGHSYIWYQHSQVGSWHMHFRLKTHQHHAVVFYSNGTDHATLEVCMAVQGISLQLQNPYSLREGNHRKNMQKYVPLVIRVAEIQGLGRPGESQAQSGNCCNHNCESFSTPVDARVGLWCDFW